MYIQKDDSTRFCKSWFSVEAEPETRETRETRENLGISGYTQSRQHTNLASEFQESGTIFKPYQSLFKWDWD